MTPLSISEVRFVEASLGDVGRGLLGWTEFVVNDSLVVEAAVRLTLKGQLRLSYPVRSGKRGFKRPVVHPRDEAARLEIERLVFQAMDLAVAP